MKSNIYTSLITDPSVSIKELDIPVNAVATALKDFFSKRLPQLIPSSMMDELTDVISGIPDRNERLVALRELIRKLPPANFEILKFVFRHFVKYVTDCQHFQNSERWFL